MSSPVSTDSKTNEDSPSEPILIMTDYDLMCLKSRDISTLHNLLASFYTWILLTGFVVFSGTFTSLRNATRSIAEAAILAELQKGLIVIVAICSSIEVVGMLQAEGRLRMVTKSYISISCIFPGVRSS